MTIVSVVGTRPEFIQATSVSRALREKHQEILVHTGRHYDYLMSQAFFDELGIPAPDNNLEVDSDSHVLTAHIEAGEQSFDRRMPEEINRLVSDCVGDLHFCVSQAAVLRLAAEGILTSLGISARGGEYRLRFLKHRLCWAGWRARSS